VPWPEERKTIEVGDVVTNFSKLTAHTGWKPTTTLAEGLQKTVAYYRLNRERYW
jgi:UDP-glucose 4-epimerase